MLSLKGQTSSVFPLPFFQINRLVGKTRTGAAASFYFPLRTLVKKNTLVESKKFVLVTGERNLVWVAPKSHAVRDVIRRSLDKTIISIENLVNYLSKLLRTKSLEAVEMPKGFPWLQNILLTFLGSH